MFPLFLLFSEYVVSFPRNSFATSYEISHDLASPFSKERFSFYSETKNGPLPPFPRRGKFTIFMISNKWFWNEMWMTFWRNNSRNCNMVHGFDILCGISESSWILTDWDSSWQKKASHFRENQLPIVRFRGFAAVQAVICRDGPGVPAARSWPNPPRNTSVRPSP